MTTRNWNLPPGILPNDRRAPWNEPEHYTRCPSHPDNDDWRPDLDALYDAAITVVNDAKGVGVEAYRVPRSAFEDLKAICETPCSCDEIDRGQAEDAAERRAEERADREDFA